MKMGKHIKRRQQQQQSGSGRAVLVTFYVTKPTRNGGGASAASSSRNVHRHSDVHHHHHHYHHHHLHDGSKEARRGSDNGRPYDRRADLLEYSRQLRATAATSTPLHPNPLPPRRNIKTVGAARHDDGLRQPQTAADDRRMGRRRLERARSQQQIRQRCLGGGDWNWKRVIMLVLPCHNNTESSTRSRNRRDGNNDDDKNNNSKAKAWPAALELVSKLKVDRSRRTSSNDNGLVKKLFSMFRQQSRSSR